jgi:hypothetical protein
VVLAIGFTVTDAVVAAVFQTYVPPPEAVSALLCPTQIVEGEALAAAAGDGLTVTVVLAVAVQPVEGFVTVTV